MPNIFDNIQDAAFDIVTNTFGDAATWTPSAGGDAITAQILYKDPSEKQGIGESDYDLDEYRMEYKSGDFEGLKQAVENGSLESVTITTRAGFLEYYVRKCTKKFDGRTIIAILNVK